MSFSSLSFLLLFLPATWAGYVLCRQNVYAKAWLLLASIVFYASLDARHVPLLIGAVVVTYAISRLMLRSQGRARTFWLVLGLAGQLGLLSICKYVPGASSPFPLGISFYTIQQAAFLVDLYQGLITSVSFLDLALFVGWFPRVVSGPILDYRETEGEFQKPGLSQVHSGNIAAGLMLLFMGLGKKVLIADLLGAWVQEGFAQASTLGALEAWVTAVSFTFQIYFDFSGYSDMAVGMARLFNIRLPQNFNSPYQATNLIDFWSRWHITLTRVITSYLYTPLIRSWMPVTFPKTLVVTWITMTLVGLWHGPAWTFVIFGAIHGTGLVLNHLARRGKWAVPGALGWTMTFLTATVAFVFFRAGSLSQALELLKGMAGHHGLLLSNRFAYYVSPLLPHTSVQVGAWRITHMGYAVVALPLLMGLLGWPHNSLKEDETFQPTWGRMVALTALMILGLLHLQEYVQFVYVNF